MKWWRFTRTAELKGLDRLIFEARQLRDHMVYLEQTTTAPELSQALSAFDGGAKPPGAGVALRDALQKAYLEVSSQVDKHTLREVLKGNPPHARNAPILASIVLAVIGVLHVLFAFHFTLWSSEGETLMSNMRDHQEFDDLAHAMDLAELRAAIEGDQTGVIQGRAGDAAILTPEQPHLIYYRGVYELSRHYREEVDLPRAISAHYTGLNPIREAWDDWQRARCSRIATQINLEQRRIETTPFLPQGADLSDDPLGDKDAGALLSLGGNPVGGAGQGEVTVGRSDVGSPTLAPAAPTWRDPRDDAKYAELFVRENEICAGQNRLRTAQLDAAAKAAVSDGDAPRAPPRQITQIAQTGDAPGVSEAFLAVDGWLAFVNIDAGRPDGVAGNNVRTPEAIRGMRDALSARLEVVHRWFLPAVYGGLGSVVYCLWRILSPDLSPLGVRYTVLRTSFAGLAAITLSMLLIPSQTLTLVAEPSRPFIYLLCFISGYSIEAFIAALSKLNEMLTSRLTPKEGPPKGAV